MELPKDTRRTNLNRMPFCKLSYENHHKKVFKTKEKKYFQIIPKGKKYLCWFTYFEDKNVIIFVTNQKQFFYYEVPYYKKLALGTILYGTLFTDFNKLRFFSIENIHYYQGKNVEKHTYIEKISIIYDILENSDSLTNPKIKDKIFMGMPIIKNSFNECIIDCKNLQYQPYSIQTYIENESNQEITASLYEEKNISSVFTFIVKADIQNDIYNLYYLHHNNEIIYDIAYIPDYKTSVFMNNFFRTIKENQNLDALEESDDEDEFENIDETKFVNLHKKMYIECKYNYKFKKFVPCNVSTKQKCVTKQEILNFQKK